MRDRVSTDKDMKTAHTNRKLDIRQVDDEVRMLRREEDSIIEANTTAIRERLGRHPNFILVSKIEIGREKKGKEKL